MNLLLFVINSNTLTNENWRSIYSKQAIYFIQCTDKYKISLDEKKITQKIVCCLKIRDEKHTQTV